MERKTLFESRPSPYNAKITVLRIDGFIDVNTVPEFEAVLEECLAQGRQALLLDFVDVTYISSAGVGVILGSLQAFRNRDQGDIKLFHVSAKIMNVFRSIGLEGMVDFLGREEEAAHWVPFRLSADFEYFAFSLPESRIECGHEFTLRIEARAANHAVAVQYAGEPQLEVSDGLVFPKELRGFRDGVWEGRLAIVGSGRLRLTVSDAGKSSEVELDVRENEQKASFPRPVACRCGTQAQVRGADIYRCRHCNEIFYVDPWAHVITLNPGNAIPLKLMRHKGAEIKINSDLNYLTSVRRFLAGLCEQESLQESTINEVVLATEEVLLNIIEHGYQFNPQAWIEIRLKLEPRKLEVRVRDRGRSFDVTQRKHLSVKSIIYRGKKGGLGAVLVNQLMDKVAYRSFPRYNQLVMTKFLNRKTDHKSSPAD